MADPVMVESVIHDLAALISPDEPKDRHVLELARATVSLLKDRDVEQTPLLTGRIIAMAFQHPRCRGR